MPRHWPPNLGANRDIPSDATIHHSVNDMVQAGIIEESPYKGGDNSHFPDVSLFTKGFDDFRKKNLKSSLKGQSTNERLPLLADGANDADHGKMWIRQG